MSPDSPTIPSEKNRGGGLTASGPNMQTSEARIVPVVQQALKLTIVVVSGLLLMRFLFALFGVNQTIGLTSFIVSLTDPLVAPFSHILESNVTVTNATFETGALLATIFLCMGGTFVIWLLEFHKGK